MIGLRDILQTDSEQLRTWRNLPEISRYMYKDHEIDEHEHSRWFAQAMADLTRRYWIITLDDEPVGMVNIYDIDADNSRAKWAFYLAEPSVRGRGVGSYVEYATLQYAFQDLSLHKLACEVLNTNPAVISMHQKFGFSIDGLLREEIFRDGHFVDVSCLSMLDHEWEAAEPGMRHRLRRFLGDA